MDYPLPNVKGAEYLLHHLNNLGWVGNGAMGIIPLSFTEIKAYMDATQTPLNGDEVLLIRKMSSSYCSELNNRDPSRKAPYTIKTIEG